MPRSAPSRRSEFVLMSGRIAQAAPAGFADGRHHRRPANCLGCASWMRSGTRDAFGYESRSHRPFAIETSGRGPHHEIRSSFAGHRLCRSRRLNRLGSVLRRGPSPSWPSALRSVLRGKLFERLGRLSVDRLFVLPSVGLRHAVVLHLPVVWRRVPWPRLRRLLIRLGRGLFHVPSPASPSPLRELVTRRSRGMERRRP